MKSWYADSGSSGPLRTRRRPGIEECVRVATPQARLRLPRYPMYVSSSLRVQYRVDRSSIRDRMPTVVGDFTSRHVYNSEILTVHSIHAPTCCRFVDVSNVKEIKKGVSWTVRVPDTHRFIVRADAYLPRTREK